MDYIYIYMCVIKPQELLQIVEKCFWRAEIRREISEVFGEGNSGKYHTGSDLDRLGDTNF